MDTSRMRMLKLGSPSNNLPLPKATLLELNFFWDKRMHLEAASLLQYICDLFPQNSLVRYNLAVELYMTERPNESIEQYELALKYHAADASPKLYKIHFRMGEILNELKRYDEALIQIDKSIELNEEVNTNYDPFLVRAETLIGLNRVDEAFEYINERIEKTPDDVEALYTKARMLQKLERHSEVIDIYIQAINIDSSEPVFWNNLVFAMVECGMFDDAFNTIDIMITNKTDNGATHSHKGYAYFKMGDLDAALEELNIAEQLDPCYPRTKTRKEDVLKAMAKL